MFEDEINAINGVVDAWFASLSGGPLAQSTDAYNQVFSAKSDLKARIAALFEQPAPPPDASIPATSLKAEEPAHHDHA